MNDTTTVTVNILDRAYEVGCRPDEVDELMRAARSLSVRMREIQRAGKVVGLDRIAVMAALNYAHEYLEMKERLARAVADTDGRAGRMAERITAALEDLGS
ncbi:MAG: cell division protein ZapA [Gammaproteobacteria bacterium]|nr:cell division protein ZapA [Gammaproteobacteria bacterium]MDE0450509.1 cell division protein ZapA [Gammaproteobacteria bacterium]